MASIIKKISKDLKEIAISARGASRGICTIWNHKMFDILNTHREQQWVKTDFKNKDNGKTFTFYNIYGPIHYRDKEQS